jgi:hypothetical protein
MFYFDEILSNGSLVRITEVALPSEAKIFRPEVLASQPCRRVG